MKHRLLTTLGICRKAGKLCMGFDAVMDAGRDGQLSLILLADDLSAKTGKEAAFRAGQYKIKLCRAPVTMDEILAVLGKRCGILGVLDPGLANTIRNTAGCVDIADFANEEELTL